MRRSNFKIPHHPVLRLQRSETAIHGSFEHFETSFRGLRFLQKQMRNKEYGRRMYIRLAFVRA